MGFSLYSALLCAVKEVVPGTPIHTLWVQEVQTGAGKKDQKKETSDTRMVLLK